MKHLLPVAALLISVVTALGPRLLADEGMWTFDNVPRALIKQQ
jgi:hypothetical protein